MTSPKKHHTCPFGWDICTEGTIRKPQTNQQDWRRLAVITRLTSQNSPSKQYRYCFIHFPQENFCVRGLGFHKTERTNTKVLRKTLKQKHKEITLLKNQLAKAKRLAADQS